MTESARSAKTRKRPASTPPPTKPGAVELKTRPSPQELLEASAAAQAAQPVDNTPPENGHVDPPPEVGDAGAGQTEAEPEDEGRTEVERLIGEPGEFVLKDGTEVEIVPLKTRQFFALMRIVTHGGGGLIMTVLGGNNTDPEEMVGQILGLLIFAIPEAEQESINFVRQMVQPRGVDAMDPKDATKARAALWDALENPEMEDLISVIEQVLDAEKDELVALGKRLIVAIQAARKNNLDMSKV